MFMCEVDWLFEFFVVGIYFSEVEWWIGYEDVVDVVVEEVFDVVFV